MLPQLVECFCSSRSPLPFCLFHVVPAANDALPSTHAYTSTLGVGRWMSTSSAMHRTPLLSTTLFNARWAFAHSARFMFLLTCHATADSPPFQSYFRFSPPWRMCVRVRAPTRLSLRILPDRFRLHFHFFSLVLGHRFV